MNGKGCLQYKTHGCIDLHEVLHVSFKTRYDEGYKQNKIRRVITEIKASSCHTATLEAPGAKSDFLAPKARHTAN